MLTKVGSGDVVGDGVHETIERWQEIRLTGQPPGPFPFFDFTFRSDSHYWEAATKVIERAREDWDRVHVSHRFVERATRSTDWTVGTG